MTTDNENGFTNLRYQLYEEENTASQRMAMNYSLHEDISISNETPIPTRASLEITDDPYPMKDGPYKTLRHWLYNSAWPGMGLFGESYMLFSIGTLKPIWEELFPDCFQDECPSRLLYSLTYSVVLGVITGMIVVGYLANTIGRRKGSIWTASVMSGGAFLLFLTSYISNPIWLYRSMSFLFFIFGLGVGGEYPLSACSASEKAMQHLLQQSKQAKAMQELERLQTALEKQQEKLNPETQQDMPRQATNSGGSTSDLSSKSAINMTTTPNDGNNNVQQSPPPQRRGRDIQLVFTMQGMGIWLNSVTLMFLLWVTKQTGNNNGGENDYNHRALFAIWRTTYVIGAIILAIVLVSRIMYLKESQVWEDDKQQREQQQAYTKSCTATSILGNNGGLFPSAPQNSSIPDILPASSSVSSLSNPTMVNEDFFYDEYVLRQVPSTMPEEDLISSRSSLLWRNYGVRLVGASLSWLLWDISFYGNKLFQSIFLLALTGQETTLLEFSGAVTLNATVALLGYFGAAALIDHPQIGRLRLQTVGFLATGGLFVACGFSFDSLSNGWLVTLYLASSFCGQLGPNATTFLIPAEIFPTEMRTLCHGICAASGKVGALIAAVVFNFLERDVDLFLLSGYASFLACIISVWTIPETTGLDLLEIDRKWRMTLEGRKKDYTGAANHPKFLSMYERHKIGLHY